MESEFVFYCFDLDQPRLLAFDYFISEEMFKLLKFKKNCLTMSVMFKSKFH